MPENAYTNEAFETLFHAPGITTSTISVEVQRLVGAVFQDLPQSPLVLDRVDESDYLFTFTFTEPGRYRVKYNSVSTTVLVSDNVLSQIKLILDNLPQG